MSDIEMTSDQIDWTDPAALCQQAKTLANRLVRDNLRAGREPSQEETLLIQDCIHALLKMAGFEMHYIKLEFNLDECGSYALLNIAGDTPAEKWEEEE